MVNLFAFRSTKPERLKKASDPIGPLNDLWLEFAMRHAHTIVAAWGNGGALFGRGEHARSTFRGRLSVFGLTDKGFPRHPLYLRSDCGVSILDACD